jgi:hypothetical protein
MLQFLETEKLSRKKLRWSILALATELQRMWNVKTKVTPVIMGATGTFSKSFKNT